MRRDDQVVAVLGAGIMASTIADTLRGNEFRLRRYNRTQSRIHGPAVVCATAAGAAIGAATVWSLVHDDDASHAVWFGPAGAMAGADGAVVIESSTLSPGYAREWSDAATAAGALPVVAPVTGSRAAAADGSLVTFAAGTDTALTAAAPVLQAVCGEIVRIGGGPAAAALTKLLNNGVAAVILTGLAEALAAADGAGLDVEQLTEVWSRRGWAAPAASRYGAAMRARDHTFTDCSCAVIAKDLRYLLAALADRVPAATSAAADRFARTVAAGHAQAEMSAVIEVSTP
ncbi:NAD(P)-binding domain-containing protein [Nocardia sp. NPDC004068]|uniref:NAD(P)-binding domain-containing protein n=1 Tax=Nocardia sp. NPDC004068 TaxID=3364303 RepID=UPI0036C6A775